MRAEAGISGEVISAHPTKDRACFQFNRQKEKTMDLDKSRLIAGVSVKYLSDALRRCGSRFSVSALAKELGTEYEPSVVARLIGLQYLKREEAPDRDRLSLTDKGKHLAAVRGIVPMPADYFDTLDYLGYRRHSLHLAPENQAWLLKKRVPHRVVFPVNDADSVSPVIMAAA